MSNARDMLVALFLVGRNFREIQEYGRILTSGERKEVERLTELSRKIEQDGKDAARAGAKQKANPYTGGSLEWWSWHESYKAEKSAIEAEKRRRPHPTQG